ncbi:MAG: NAD(P)-binding domain-containing protein, partial [Rhizobiales bacterium]|nr:NAD(P)-binding domain-containing protein [Hyphomicrobiales bacterium]
MSGSVSKNIGVIGGGAWGTALAVAACNAGHKTTLWARNAEIIAGINCDHQNKKYLPDVPLPDSLMAVSDFESLQTCDVVLLVIPTQQLRSIFTAFAPFWDVQKPVILCAKGVEQSTGMLPSEILHDVAPKQSIAALSGPSFAVDVVAGKPTAVTLAAPKMETAEILCRLLAS